MKFMEIIIVDNGGQYVHRIWRSLREIGVKGKIVSNTIPPEKAITSDVIGIILSGGPDIKKSGYSEDYLEYCIEHNLPILGICLGHQIIGRYFGAEVGKGSKGEYGSTLIKILEKKYLFEGFPDKISAWASHMDEVKDVPKEFLLTATSDVCLVEGMRHKRLPIFGIQFHPEVSHTPDGKKILRNFYEICRFKLFL